jgi:hypothetical protein
VTVFREMQPPQSHSRSFTRLRETSYRIFKLNT